MLNIVRKICACYLLDVTSVLIRNRYFALWLKDYTAKYNQWALGNRSRMIGSKPSSTSYRTTTWNDNPTCSSLALHYARAKQTFFTPNRESPYELNINTDLLSPFHTSNLGSPHPDPAVFTEVAVQVNIMLKESLDRMVVGAYTNVGTNRGLCGIVGGACITLLGSLPPLLVNFVTGKERLLRLLVIPGMWLGLTIMLASLHGVCMMVYIFGDLRQLRKFELSRPPISRPQMLSDPRTRPVISHPHFKATPCPTPILPVAQPPIVHNPHPAPLVTPPPPVATNMSAVTFRAADRPSSSGSELSFVSSSDSESASSSSASSSSAASETNPAPLTIEISPAYYDPSRVEGPATGSPTSPTRYFAFPSKGDYIDELNSRACSPEWAPTAPFIHPYDPLCDEDYDSTREMTPEERQRLGPFDFDLLPPKQGHTLTERRISVVANTKANSPPRRTSIVDAFDVLSALKLPGRKLGQAQEKCNENQRPISHTAEKSESRSDSTTTPPVDPSEQFKLIRAVPAFKSPFTRVLEPVVTRAQWEIVVRSMFLAGVISWAIVGCLLSVPVRR